MLNGSFIAIYPVRAVLLILRCCFLTADGVAGVSYCAAMRLRNDMRLQAHGYRADASDVGARFCSH